MDQAWWRGAVLYQVIPRSFQDSDGDGVGDLAGVIARLDHIAGLGVDGLWLSPFYRSPQVDFGYDVADHCAVDPGFGTLAQFDHLLAEAHGRGLKVMIDLVLGHTSDRHAWFADSRAGRAGPRADWYVWADPRPDGGPPNNWLSVFGGPAWTWEPRRRQYYLHHFLACQPALNGDCPAVRAALLEVAEFWLRRGVDGFRLDAVDFLGHHSGLPDNPARAPDPVWPPLKPFGMQDHLYDMARPDIADRLGGLRALVDRYPAVATMAEVSSQPQAIERIRRYTAGGDRLHMAYSLKLMAGGLTAPAWRATLAEIEDRLAGGGWMCWAFSNHDVMRVASRWGDGGPGDAKLALAMLVCLRGSLCLYQGEELGLPEAELPVEAWRDPYGLAFQPEFKGRDGCRTPMPWQAGAPQCGFTTGTPWLPLPEAHRALAVDRQLADPESVLHTARRLLAWRRAEPALRHGDLVPLPGDDQVVAWTRGWAGRRLLCAFNLGTGPATVAVPAGGPLHLPPRSAGFAEIADQRRDGGP